MPAAHEEARGRPFVGPSGMLLERWLRDVGLSRADCYVTNVVPYRHNPSNDVKRVPKAELAEWEQALRAKLDGLSPRIIVPMGNVALHALTGKYGITKHRGSVYGGPRDGQKLIPTLHPAATFRTPSWVRRCQLDWRRIVDDLSFPDVRRPEREHHIRPTVEDLRDFVDDAARHAVVLAFDIETPRKRTVTVTTTKTGKQRITKGRGDARITCIGFSFEPSVSLTVPTTLAYWRDPQELETVWGLIRALLALPCDKAAQNHLFDTWWLSLPEYRVPVTNMRWDTRWMSHARFVLDEHSLAYQASIYTRESYWKDDAKDDLTKEFGDVKDIEAFWRYCGTDAAVTCELANLHHTALAADGRLRFYEREYADLFPAMLRMIQHGIAVDQRWRARQQMRGYANILGLQDRLTALAGEPLHAAKDLSTKKLAQYLYQTLGLPVQRNRSTGGITTDEVTVRRLMLRYTKQLRDVGPAILDYRRQSKLVSFLKEDVADPDDRIRSSYGWVDTGRLNSGKNPRRRGTNLQNTDRELLRMFVPDAGCIFVEVDLSQAEDRVVKALAYALTKREALIERARAMPWENDEHLRAASAIFHRPLAELTRAYDAKEPIAKQQRYLGKRTRHANNYDIHGRALSHALLKEGLIITPEEAQRNIDTLNEADPDIAVWKREIRTMILRDRSLVNGWGRVIDFEFERLNDDLYRRGYAFLPQSEVVGVINRWAFGRIDDWFRTHGDGRVNNQKHDSLLLSVKPPSVWLVMNALRQWLERPRRYWGVELMIPCEFKIGAHGALDVEYKRFPVREQVEADVARMLKS